MRLLFLFAISLVVYHTSTAQRPLWLGAWGGSPLPTGKEGGGFIGADAVGSIYTGGGITDTITTQNQSALLSKYSANGQLLWSKRWGGKMKAEISQMTVTAGGDIYVAGSFGAYNPPPFDYRDTVDFGGVKLVTHGYSDIFLARFNKEGQLKWVRQFGGKLDDDATALHVTPTGNFYLAGRFDDTVYFDTTRLVRKTPNDVFLVKGDTAGNLIWTKYLQTGFIGGVGVDRVGDLYISGSFNNDYAWFGTNKVYHTNTAYVSGAPYTASYDSGFTLKWVRLVSGSNNYSSRSSTVGTIACSRFNVLPDGSSLMTGMYERCDIHLQAGPSFPDRNQPATFLIKYSATGDVVWAHVGDGQLRTVPDEAGAIYLVGTIITDSHFDNVTIASGLGYREEPAVVQYDSSGVVQWGIKALGVGSDYATGLAFSPDRSRIYVIGTTQGPSVQFGAYSISNPGYWNAFVGILSSKPTGVSTTELLGPSFQISPNPAASRALVQFNAAVTGTLTLFSVQGAVVRSLPVVRQPSVSFPLDGLPAGTYSLRLQTAVGGFARQLIVQP